MATPLFVPDEATLESKLRLSSTPASATDTRAILNEAVQRARTRIYRALGASRVTQLLAITYSETPTTGQGILRLLAANVEVKIVYCTLLRMLPNAFMDASGDINKRWNEEAPFRERGPSELEQELLRCESEIIADLDELKDNDLDACPDVLTFDGTPDCPTPLVGRTLKNRSAARRLFGNDPNY